MTITEQAEGACKNRRRLDRVLTKHVFVHSTRLNNLEKNPRVSRVMILWLVMHVLLVADGFSLVGGRYRQNIGVLSKDARTEGFPLSNSVFFLPRDTSRQRPSRIFASADGQHDEREGASVSRNFASNRRKSLRWVVQSIEKFGVGEDEQRPHPSLVMAMNQLLHAKTQTEIAELGRVLESLQIHKESFEVQERVIKALAIVGLVWLALDLLDGMLSQNFLPSSMAYVAVCSSLRQMGRVRRLEKLLFQLGDVSRQNPYGPNVDVVALNCFLAALCDEATQKGASSQQNQVRKVSKLQTAWKWLKPGMSQGVLGTEPDVTSFTTVLSAAASVGNSTLADMVWEEMQTHKFEPNLYTYNSRLRALANYGEDADAQVLSAFDQLLREPTLQPDQYTIDLVLAPLTRVGRVGDMESLLETFAESHSGDVRLVSNAFSSFLVSLVKARELSTAQAIFDTYIFPKKTSSNVSLGRVRPGVRHFNIMIEGYRQNEENRQGEEHTLEGYEEEEPVANYEEELAIQNSVSDGRRKACALYQALLDTGLRPDSYTLTSMIGITSTPMALTSLLSEAIKELHVDITPVVLRAAMTRCGQVGDPSSACWLFGKFCRGTMNVRTWNVLLGALAAGAKLDCSGVLHVEHSMLAGSLKSPLIPHAHEEATNEAGQAQKNAVTNLVSTVENMTCVQATKSVLSTMMGNPVKKFPAPKPNSQTYCIAASAFQHGPVDVNSAMDLFRTATKRKLSADGRFINAIFRCFGDDIDAAINAWKREVRRACISHEYRTRTAPASIHRTRGKNLIASYHGLLYVCGRALRPDIAVRLVYAMNKEGLEPNENALNCYRSGKRDRRKLANESNPSDEELSTEKKRISMGRQYETLLQVECLKYDKNDRRRDRDQRIRIIV